jgi:PPOX class probable F420-dependent enzyme
MLDFTTDLGRHALTRLATEEVIWLTTVGPDGTPQPNPVWFLWENVSFLIYIQPGSVKARNLKRNPNVALNFNSDRVGDDVLVFTGKARLEESVSPESAAAYLDKYRDGIDRIDMTPESLMRSFSMSIRIVPKRLRGF